MDHSRSRFVACTVLAFALALLASSPSARAGYDAGEDEGEYESVEPFDVDEKEVANMFALGNLAISVVTFDSVSNGDGNTVTGVLTMLFGGISAAVGFHDDHSLLAAAGSMSFVAGLASVAMSLTKKPESRTGMTAEPFVATIAGDTHVGLMASIRY